MMITRIVVTRRLLDSDLNYIQRGLNDVVPGQFEIIIPKTFDESGITDAAKGARVLLGPYVSRSILNQAPTVELIQIPWTGVETLNFDAIRGTNVLVCKTHSNALAVAEFAIALALDLMKKISFHDQRMRVGDWNRRPNSLDLTSVLLAGRTACVLGYGHIGQKIGNLLKAFDANVIAVARASRRDSSCETVLGQEELIRALEQASICFCCLPLTTATQGLLSETALRSLPPGAFLINVSRAAVIDEDALFALLSSGNLGGFAADVWWNEPRRGESESKASLKHAFESLDNVVFSPHRAGFIEGDLPHLMGAVQNIAALIQGYTLSGVVDIEQGY
jgi:phosphoglycerate dehydrogenase-like enzyme